MITVNSKKYEITQELSLRTVIEMYCKDDKAMKINDELMIVINGKGVKVNDIDSVFIKDDDKIILLHSIAGG